MINSATSDFYKCYSCRNTFPVEEKTDFKIPAGSVPLCKKCNENPYYVRLLLRSDKNVVSDLKNIECVRLLKTRAGSFHARVVGDTGTICGLLLKDESYELGPDIEYILPRRQFCGTCGKKIRLSKKVVVETKPLKSPIKRPVVVKKEDGSCYYCKSKQKHMADRVRIHTEFGKDVIICIECDEKNYSAVQEKMISDKKISRNGSEIKWRRYRDQQTHAYHPGTAEPVCKAEFAPYATNFDPFPPDVKPYPVCSVCKKITEKMRGDLRYAQNRLQ
ncbi:hypothetical protein [Methanolapillus millepedarum]|uniref:Uncharacterized protein n=1 Tax=Methanolapillus millepedarum TaxID=3028296 RepID=A0AA96ZW48_9EURY|nr:hypothetical protein MsAc7_17390 [Methanosarcinaceae archaeon Ac7]